MKITNKILSLILCVAMIVSMGSFVYASAAATEKANGVCGTNATWKLYDDGTLVISGKGTLKDCSNGAENSYFEYKDEIKADSFHHAHGSAYQLAFLI